MREELFWKSNMIEGCKTFIKSQEGDEKILGFIYGFKHGNPAVNPDGLVGTFKHGYCYHFAQMLKAIFKTGTVCLHGSDAHCLYVAEDGTAYDITGVYPVSKELIPMDLMPEDLLNGFLHVYGLEFTNDLKDIVQWYIEAAEQDETVRDFITGVGKVEGLDWTRRRIRRKSYGVQNV